MKQKTNKYDNANLVRTGNNEITLVNDNDRTAKKINSLYANLKSNREEIIKTYIEIGRLLHEKKNEIEFGKFELWINENLSFGARQAQKYLKAYDGKELILAELERVEKEESELEFVTLSDTVKFISTNIKDDNSKKGKVSIDTKKNEVSKLERELDSIKRKMDSLKLRRQEIINRLTELKGK